MTVHNEAFGVLCYILLAILCFLLVMALFLLLPIEHRDHRAAIPDPQHAVVMELVDSPNTSPARR
ncbi:MAG TPA: hypothetical protein VES58_03395 [Syntrophobacteria bacterium]|nr:hypothetical protein [Syntrophobacteria bacterium]